MEENQTLRSSARSGARKRKRKLKRKAILGLIVLTILIGGSCVTYLLWQQFFGKVNATSLVKSNMTSLEILNEKLIPKLTEQELSVLEDYQFNLNMLLSQVDESYSEEDANRLRELGTLVQAQIDAQELNELENMINSLAYEIDAKYFTIGPSSLHFERGILILNKVHSVGADFSPGFRPIVQDAYERMATAAADEGIYLTDFSTYRSYGVQEGLFNRYASNYGEEEANRFSARPGYSEHQSGYALDIGGTNNPGAWAESWFDGTDEALWLEKNAPSYGFILRYLPEKEDITGYIHESWHFRYVGEIAPKITITGLTLEEYFGMV